MTWEEKPAGSGKWTSDMGYAIRQREDRWQLYNPDGRPAGVPRPTLEAAQMYADEHVVEVSGG